MIRQANEDIKTIKNAVTAIQNLPEFVPYESKIVNFFSGRRRKVVTGVEEQKRDYILARTTNALQGSLETKKEILVQHGNKLKRLYPRLEKKITFLVQQLDIYK